VKIGGGGQDEEVDELSLFGGLVGRDADWLRMGGGILSLDVDDASSWHALL
jgi:hypothetical protein